MAFQGPAAHDLENVFALNAAFLELVADAPEAIRAPSGLPLRFGALGKEERSRLARTPILLLSVAEDDMSKWAPVFEARVCRDLFSDVQRPPARIAELVAATLGFLWQLACRDPYAVRVLSGASIEWCEALAGSLLIDVLEFGGREPGLLTMRLADHVPFWNKLLCAATSGSREVRFAARLCALQTALTGSARPRRHLRAAACSKPAASMVAERRPRPG